MKAKISFVIIGVMLFCGMAFADVIISLKDGNIYKWKNYTETNVSYCTSNYDGEFCISKADVISVKEARNDVEANKEPTTEVQSTPIPTKRLKQYYPTKRPTSVY